MKDLEKKISNMLEDLSAIDPAFAARKREMKPLIKSMIAIKPEPNLDQDFSMRLRNSLMETAVSPKRAVASPYASFFMSVSNRLTAGAVGALLALVVAVPLTYFAAKKSTTDLTQALTPNSIKNASTGLSLKQQINSKGTNAFGKLALLPQAATTSTSESTALSTTVIASNTVAPASAVDSAAPIKASPKLSYNYVGDAIKLDGDQGTVFKRDESLDASRQISDFFQNWKFGFANISTFSKVSVQNVTLSQDGAPGYIIGLDFNQGSISIVDPKADAVPQTVATSSVPEDSVLVGIANDFLSAHAVDVTSYGKPYVESQISKDDKVSGRVAVVYPLFLEKQEVYDENGKPYGLRLIVDISSKKVVSIENLVSQTYESSPYALETDSARIIDKLPHASTSEADAVNVGTPSRVLMRYLVTDANGSTSELYVPALLFTSTSTPTAAPVIIPLLRDTLGRAPTPAPTDAVAAPDATSSTSSTTAA